MRCEVPEERCFIGEAHAADAFALLPDFKNDLDEIIDVTLCVYAAWNREAHEVHSRSGGEDERANFDGAHATFKIKLASRCTTGEFCRRNVRQECARVEIDGMASGRLDDGHAFASDVIAEVSG